MKKFLISFRGGAVGSGVEFELSAKSEEEALHEALTYCVDEGLLESVINREQFYNEWFYFFWEELDRSEADADFEAKMKMQSELFLNYRGFSLLKDTIKVIEL